MNFIFLSILVVIVCIALIAITMVQNSKKEDEGNTLGSLGVHILMGVKQTNDFLTGTTWVLMVSLFLICLGFHHVTKNRQGDFVSPNLEMLKKQQSENLDDKEVVEKKEEVEEKVNAEDKNGDNSFKK